MFGKVDSMASPQPSCSKAKLDSLFLQWFSLASTQQLVLELLDDVKHGRRAALTPAARKGHSPSNQASCRRRRCRSR
ncbi:hypothetical protein ABPG77_006424 [Micractinium sp. CCAP 211/92]